MKSLISICLVLSLEVSIGLAQDSNALTTDGTSTPALGRQMGDSPAEPALQPVAPKRITVLPTSNAPGLEAAMKFIEQLEKEGFETSRATAQSLTPDESLQARFAMLPNESRDKIKQFFISLGNAGVRQIFLETGRSSGDGNGNNLLAFRAIPGYSSVEVERIENAAISAAESCGLALTLGGTYVKFWKPTGESATHPSLRPVEPKRIAIFAQVDREPSEIMMRFIADLERDGIANVENNASAATSKYPIQLNFSTGENESLEKVRQFIVALRQSGVEQINCDFRRHHDADHMLLFTAIPGYSHEEQQRIENAARTAAEKCGLSVSLVGTMVFPSNINARKVAQLRSEFEAANKQAHDLAESHRQTPDAAKKSELRLAVQRAFTLRQSLLRAELQEMQARLEKTQQSIDMQERIADQIVDRRVEDMLNPQLKREEKLQPEVTSAVNASEPDIRSLNAATCFVPELEGDWHRVGASADQTGAETPHFNITIHGNTWTDFIDQKSEAIAFLCDTAKKTIEFKSTPPLVYRYEVYRDTFILRNETQSQAFDRGHRLQPDALTELEGDWHQISATDKGGNPLTVRPANMSFRKDRYTFAYQGGQHDRRVEVFANKKKIRYFKEGEYNGFVQDHYLLEGDQLTIYDENRKNVFQRGHVALPKSISKATEEQKSSWRSGIVEIYWEHQSPTDLRQDPVGKGVVISPKGLVICQIPEEIQREKDAKTKFVVRFDDGGFAYATIVEEADHGWFALQPTQSGNHQFPIATSEINSGDQVHLWACDSSSPPQRVTVDLATVTLLNRHTEKATVPVCQLTRPTDFRAESCPVLSGDGELLGITLRDTGDLVLAVPGSQLKSMFPKTFAQ